MNRLTTSALYLLLILQVIGILKPVWSQDQKSPSFRLSAIWLQNAEQGENVLLQLREGADFAILAKKYSIGPKQEMGGDIGNFRLQDLPDDLQSFIEKLKVGEYTRVLILNHRYVILKKTEQEFSNNPELVESPEKDVKSRWRNLNRQLNDRIKVLMVDGKKDENSDLTEEISLARKALHLAETELKKDSEALALSMHDLALFYMFQERYAEAESLLLRSIEVAGKSLKSPQTLLFCLNGLGAVYHLQDKYSDAQKIYERILKTEKLEDYLSIDTIMEDRLNLASIYLQQELYPDAAILLQQNFDKLDEIIAQEDPPETQLVEMKYKTLILLRVAYLPQDKNKAEKYYIEYITHIEKFYGSTDPALIRALEQLAEFYDSVDKTDEAERTRERIKNLKSKE